MPRKSLLLELKNHQIVRGLEDISEWGANAKVFQYYCFSSTKGIKGPIKAAALVISQKTRSESHTLIPPPKFLQQTFSIFLHSTYSYIDKRSLDDGGFFFKFSNPFMFVHMADPTKTFW